MRRIVLAMMLAAPSGVDGGARRLSPCARHNTVELCDVAGQR
jgi:hypothetical protein